MISARVCIRDLLRNGTGVGYAGSRAVPLCVVGATARAVSMAMSVGLPVCTHTDPTVVPRVLADVHVVSP